MPDIELKPCLAPWCKATANLIPRYDGLPPFTVECSACGLSTEKFDTPEEAAAAWNDRPWEARIAELEAQVKEIMDEACRGKCWLCALPHEPSKGESGYWIHVSDKGAVVRCFADGIRQMAGG